MLVVVLITHNIIMKQGDAASNEPLVRSERSMQYTENPDIARLSEQQVEDIRHEVGFFMCGQPNRRVDELSCPSFIIRAHVYYPFG